MTKLIKIFLILTMLFVYSCKKEEHTSLVPNISFNILIPLQSYPKLQTIGNAVYFTSFNGQILGYKGHGIYVIKTGSDVYRAFDATCTHDIEVVPHVLLEINGYECSVCNSFFELFTGNVVKDPATYPLKSYNAVLTSGLSVQVQN